MYKYECDYCGDPLCPEICPEAKQNNKSVVWRDKCGYADRYKGIQEPTCGCQVCRNKWIDKQVTSRQGGVF